MNPESILPGEGYNHTVCIPTESEEMSVRSSPGAQTIKPK